jgi:T4 RnlA family RNA ligase
MKIDLDKVDRTQFMVHEHILNGEVVHLIQPQHIGVSWTQDNKHMRSVVVNYDGEVISASFPKFFNWSEQPDLSPVPTSLKNTTVVEKLDGSTLIVSKYNGQYILRTRGTVDASTMANGHELEIFKERFKDSLQRLGMATPETWNVSLLFEWVSPINKIVLNYGEEPDWYIVGIVNHSDYSLFTQSELDMWSKKYDFKRPATYTFSSVQDLLKDVDQWRGKEGVVVYSKNDQMLHKVKGAWYLALHHMKSELSNIEKVLDVWLEQGMTDYQTFYSYIFTTFDFELAEQIKGTISRIVDGKKEVNKIVDGMNNFVNNRLRSLPSRKEQAQLVISSYGETNRAAFVFKLLDGKSLGKEEYKKLLFQVLKN